MTAPTSPPAEPAPVPDAPLDSVIADLFIGAEIDGHGAPRGGSRE